MAGFKKRGVAYENFEDSLYLKGDFNTENSIKFSIDEDRNIPSGASITTNTPFIYKLGAGFDLYMIDVLALNFEVSYRWTRIKYTGNYAGISANAPGEVNADALYIGGGLKLKY